MLYSLQVFQRLRLSNGDESAALGELLRWRRAQCEGRGNWKHRPPQSPPLPPTLLWTNRKTSPWKRLCDAVTCFRLWSSSLAFSSATLTHARYFFFLYVDQVTSTPRGKVKAPSPKAWASSLGWRSCLCAFDLDCGGFPNLYDRSSALCDTDWCYLWNISAKRTQ